MNQIDTVWSLANKFVDSAKLVTINDEAINRVAKDIVKWAEVNVRPLWNFPMCIKSGSIEKMFLYELIANSVNYCYWYGRHDIRPNGASSTKMCSLLDESFNILEEMKKTTAFHPHNELKILIGTFISKLSMARFPLIDKRAIHLTEILNAPDLLSMIKLSVQNQKDYGVDKWLEYIITSFPGYSKDLFLKRAFLFIMQMYRRCEVFGKEIGRIPVPADCQVPKVLRWLGCLEYKYPLDFIVANKVPLAEDSSIECEIRAATIIVCKRIADLAGCTCEEVDSYLWGKRKQCKDVFHLCVTSNY